MKTFSISYDEYGKLLSGLINKISNSNDKFCAVHGLMKGGLPIAVAISNALNIPLTVNIAELGSICYNKLILVVDDIIVNGSETGFGRFVEIALLKKIKYKSASLYCKENLFQPDFYEVKIKKNEWIEFPWGHSTKN